MNTMTSMSVLVLVLLATFKSASCWDSNEMEVFDAYEEVNENFYQLMSINEDATLPEIKRAYRTLSKQLHPDKNDAPDAEVKFRQLVSVYEVLKDPDKRRIYNRVLVEGPPDWRSAIYYYRRARKMSMMEIVLILTVVISVAQYFMAWGSYWDKWRTIEYHTSKKLQKKKKKRPDEGPVELNPLDAFEALMPKPSIMDILPIQVCMMSYRLVRYGPSMYRQWREDIQRKEQLIKEQKEREAEEERQKVLEEEERKARKAAPKKRRKMVIPERKDVPVEEGDCVRSSPGDPYEAAAAGLNTGLWSTEEFSELAKLMNKFPGGTLDRWEVIAQHLNRSTYEVTKMAQKVREKLASGSWLQGQEESVQSKIKVKTRTSAETSSTSSDAHWSAVQQKSLEKAIKSFPKGTDQRWERIAKQVPDKTAEECISRFKFLAERIKKKKEEENAAKENEEIDKEQTEHEENEDKEECSNENGDDSEDGDSDETDGASESD